MRHGNEDHYEDADPQNGYDALRWRQLFGDDRIPDNWEELYSQNPRPRPSKAKAAIDLLKAVGHFTYLVMKLTVIVFFFPGKMNAFLEEIDRNH